MTLKQKFLILLLGGLFVLLIFLAGLIRLIYFESFPAAAPKRKLVLVSNYKFFPEAVRVRYGDTVAWKNVSDTSHTVTFRTLSKTLMAGETWEWTITPEYFLKWHNMYWCDFHANTKGMLGGRVVVE
jgi:plastocyanin